MSGEVLAIGLKGEKGEILSYKFFCPGCKWWHNIFIRPYRDVYVWEWNGSLTTPTFNPSIGFCMHTPDARCHSWVKGGLIEFLNDSFHRLAGQTVPLPTIEDAITIEKLGKLGSK